MKTITLVLRYINFERSFIIIHILNSPFRGYMEPGVRKYLIRILNTLSVGLLWMVLNSTLGIKYDFAFVNDHITKGNILFYIWFVLSFIAFIRWVIRLWSKPIDYEE